MADTSNNAIRTISPQGNVNTIISQYSLDHPLKAPKGIIYKDNNLYISDLNNGIINLKINIEEFSKQPLKLSINNKNLNYKKDYPHIDTVHLRIPLKETLESLGMKVVWNNKNKTIEASKGDKKYLFLKNEYTAINGVSYLSEDVIKEKFNLDTAFDLFRREVSIKGGI